MSKQYEVHPAAKLFPMMDKVSFQALKEDIETHGIKEFGTLYRGQLLDGRNRYKACQELGIEMDFCEIEEEEDFDPIAYVLSHNLHRRHLDESQRGMVAAKLAKLKRGGNRKSNKIKGPIGPPTVAEASKQLKVGTGTTKRAKVVIEHGSDSVQQAVEQGNLPVSVAAELVKKVPDKEQQTKLIEDGVDTVRDAIKTIAQDDKIVWEDVDDEPVPKKSAPKTKRAPAPKQDFGIELHEWLRRNTGNLQAYSEMINGLTGDWKEVLQLNHPVIWDEFVKAVCQLHASIENAQA